MESSDQAENGTWGRVKGFVLACLFVGVPLAAQIPTMGLSSVGGQAFGNEDLFFYQPEPGESFGGAVATGDFNGDSIDDLATGIPSDHGFTGDPILGCGAVVVRYGAPGGRLATGLADDFLNQLASGSPDPAEPSELFGSALAAGDFDGDGIDDLAIGIPQNKAGAPAAGAVQIHYGRAGGIQLVGEHVLRQGVNGIPGTPANWDRFGLALASGNFDGDSYADLAVGIPDDDLAGPLADAGSVIVFHGGANGLLPFAGYLISQAEAEIAEDAEAGDGFGYPLAAGDFDGNGQDDLAIGVLFETDDSQTSVGAVQVVFGSPFGLLFANNRIYFRSTVGGSGNESRFASALAAGDVDGDGRDELVIGDPRQDFLVSSTLRQDAGAVFVLYGSGLGAPNWFDLSRTDWVHQGNLFGPTAQQSYDYFGSALAVGDFDGDGRAEIAIGQPGEDLGGQERGGVTVVARDQIQTAAHTFRFLSPGLGGLPGVSQDGQAIGYVLTTGDFDDNGHLDLVMGAPAHDVEGIGVDVGSEVVFYGARFADGFDAGSTFFWGPNLP
jgi:hypothetical protein